MVRKARKPGRPRSGHGTDVRERLLAEASLLFAAKGFASTTLRDLAQAAGVTTAMVSYYFGSKDGLYRALLEQALEEFLPSLAPPAESGPAPTVETLVQRFLALTTLTMVAKPWIPALLVREVLSEGGSFREEFIRRFASRVAGHVIGVLERAAAAGELRPGVDPRLAYVSLIGLVMFPLIGRPVFESILGVSFDDPGFRAALTDHGRRVFLEGVGAGAPA